MKSALCFFFFLHMSVLHTNSNTSFISLILVVNIHLTEPFINVKSYLLALFYSSYWLWRKHTFTCFLCILTYTYYFSEKWLFFFLHSLAAICRPGTWKLFPCFWCVLFSAVSSIPVTRSFKLLFARREQNLLLHLPLRFPGIKWIIFIMILKIIKTVEYSSLFYKTATQSLFSKNKYTVKLKKKKKVFVHWEKLYAEVIYLQISLAALSFKLLFL